MAIKPEDWQMKASTKNLDPVATLEATINDMHDPQLEAELVKRGLAVEAED